MNVEHLVAEHCDYNRISDGRRTLMLRILRMWEQRYGPLQEIDAPKFERFLGDLHASGYNVNTTRKFGNIIRVYSRRMWLRGELNVDAYMRILEVPNPRGATSKTKPRPYSKKEIKQLYEDIDARWPIPSEMILSAAVSRWQMGRTRRSYWRVYPYLMNLQVRAIVALALDCGMRANEIYSVTVQDIHPDNEYIVVRVGKGEISGEPKYREVPWTAYARAAVARWLDVRQLHKPKHESPWLVLSPKATQMGVVPSSRDAPMSQRRFALLMGSIGEGWSLHRLRHTCATMKLRGGMRLEALSRFLGHSNIAQTLCYAEIARVDVQRESERVEGVFNDLIGERT